MRETRPKPKKDKGKEKQTITPVLTFTASMFSNLGMVSKFLGDASK